VLRGGGQGWAIDRARYVTHHPICSRSIRWRCEVEQFAVPGEEGMARLHLGEHGCRPVAGPPRGARRVARAGAIADGARPQGGRGSPVRVVRPGGAGLWSDVDLVVFLSDDVIARVVEERMGFPDRFGTLVYRLDSTWNAPIDGAQVNALYRLRSGLPLYVDWNLWPSSRAALPTDTKALCGRRPHLLTPVDASFEEWAQAIPRQPRPTVGAVDPEILRHARFGMVPIAAKYAARGDRHGLVRLLTGIGAEQCPKATRRRWRRSGSASPPCPQARTMRWWLPSGSCVTSWKRFSAWIPALDTSTFIVGGLASPRRPPRGPAGLPRRGLRRPRRPLYDSPPVARYAPAAFYYVRPVMFGMNLCGRPLGTGLGIKPGPGRRVYDLKQARQVSGHRRGWEAASSPRCAPSG